MYESYVYYVLCYTFVYLGKLYMTAYVLVHCILRSTCLLVYYSDNLPMYLRTLKAIIWGITAWTGHRPTTRPGHSEYLFIVLYDYRYDCISTYF